MTSKNAKTPPMFLAVASRIKGAIQRHAVLVPQHQRAEYVDPPGLHAAIDAAMLLGLPLLLTGEPGTGKTQAAYWLSNALGESPDPNRPKLLRTDVKSTMMGRELLYRFDEVARFRDSAAGETKPLIEYIEFEALGEAIIRAAGGSAKLFPIGTRAPEDICQKVFGWEGGEMVASDLLPGDASFKDAPACARVVLIDEIDKAPFDTPNDLLAEVENMAFAIPEFGLRVDASRRDNETKGGPAPQRPIVLITSNSERDLPEPFLRRCASFHLPFPTPETLRRIVAQSVPPLVGEEDSNLVTSVTEFWTDLLQLGGLSRPPSTAEFLAWCACLTGGMFALKPSQTLKDVPPKDRLKLIHTLGCFVKKKADLDIAQRMLRTRIGMAQE